MPEIWERQPGESTRAFEAFRVYRDLCPKRSQEKVASELSKSRQLIARWSARFSWLERSAAFDAYVDRRRLEAVVRGRAEMAERQVKNSMLMQDLAIEALSRMELGQLNGSQIARLFEAGSKAERELRGDPHEEQMTEIHFHVHRRSDKTMPVQGTHTTPTLRNS